MHAIVLLSLMFGCNGKDSDDTVVDTDSDSDTEVSLREGDPCNPDATDECGEGTLCCTTCCRTDEIPVCTMPDVNGVCPLPDIAVNAGRLESTLTVQDLEFAEGDCAIEEGCVDAPGWRRLLRFDTSTPNIGTANLHFGNPDDSDLFVYSECHNHMHFETYATYRLLDAQGNEAATGRKQAFCLMDFEHDPAATGQGPAVYYCGFQGISMGWQDTYDSYLDCQWIDITDVAAGDYTLEVDLNAEEVVPELDYANNLVSVPVQILDREDEPPVSSACSAEEWGAYRNCGWTAEISDTCTPGATVDVGCKNCESSQDTVFRVCDGENTECRGVDAIANIENFGDCAEFTFTCPDSGEYTVLTSAYWGGDASCEL